MKKKANKKSSSSFDSLYNYVLVKLFETINDKRASNKSYQVLDALKSGFAIYSLKFASLFSFRGQSKAENSNLRSVYGIKDIPSDNTLRNILDRIEPNDIRKGFHELFKRIKKIGILSPYEYWNKSLIVSVDGVEHFSSKSIHCEHCMQREHRDGTTSFYHSMLSSAIVHPDKKEVFILDNEPIVKQDGSKKNDCERNAAQRLLDNLESLYSENRMVFVFDALYACAPVVKRFLNNHNWKFVTAVKSGGNKSLMRQFNEMDDQGEVKWEIQRDTQGEHSYGWINGLMLNDSNTDIKVNMLWYKHTNKKGQLKEFTWISNIELKKGNVEKVMKMGRSRWKIENETFNTLKNQNYNFEHNFGHGKEHLCTNFAFLMMLAFYVDQIQQSNCVYFQSILTELKTRIKLWEYIRAVFKIKPQKSMEQIHLSIMELYQIELETPK